MAVNPVREVVLSKYKMSRLICFDATTAYIAFNVSKWKTSVTRTLNDAVLSKITPYRLLATTLFNVASGHWLILKQPYSDLRPHLQKNDRTPMQTLEATYLTIIPAYVTEIAKHLKTLHDAVDARDFVTAKEQANAMSKLLINNVADIPKDVTDYLDELPKLSDICNITYGKTSKLGGTPKVHLRVKKNISEATLAETFGRFLVYKGSNKPILDLKPIDEVDEQF